MQTARMEQIENETGQRPEPQRFIDRNGNPENAFPSAKTLSDLAGAIVTGYVVQATHSFFWAFAAAGIFLLIGIAGYVFLLGSMEPVPEPA